MKMRTMSGSNKKQSFYTAAFYMGAIMILKQCARCGCMIAYGKKYCERCKSEAEADRQEYQSGSRRKSNHRYNKSRDKKYTQFYNSKPWRNTALSYMQSVGYKCGGKYDNECRLIATQVHHIVPIQTPEGWERRFDTTNLRALCTHCHNIEHDRFKKRIKNNTFFYTKK